MTPSFEVTQIVAALIRQGEMVLLVRQQAPDDPGPSWALPGGRVEVSEGLEEALKREVTEETGLVVRELGQLVYSAQLAAPVERKQTLAFVFEVAAWEGEIACADPDGVILEASFTPVPQAVAKLETLPWRGMREPVTAYLKGEAAPGEIWFYREDPEGELALVAKIP